MGLDFLPARGGEEGERGSGDLPWGEGSRDNIKNNNNNKNTWSPESQLSAKMQVITEIILED